MFGGQNEPVTLLVETSENVTNTYTFEVWVVELPATVTVYWSDGLVEKTDISQGIVTSDPGEYHRITRVEFA